MSLALCNGHHGQHAARTHRTRHSQDLPVFQWPWGRSFMDAYVAARSCINPRHLRGDGSVRCNCFHISDALAGLKLGLLPTPSSPNSRLPRQFVRTRCPEFSQPAG